MMKKQAVIMKRQPKKELTERQRQMGIATRNKRNKLVTNRILAKKNGASKA